MSKDTPSTYTDMIIADTGCTRTEAPMIEDIMRNEIFHSTLDWQTRQQLRQGAREAHGLLKENREDYEKHYAGVRRVFEMKRGSASVE